MSRLREFSMPARKSVWPTAGDMARAERRGTLYSPDGTILITETAEGTALQAAGGGGGHIVQITGGGPGNTYTGDVYGNGPTETATETGVTIRQAYINAAATLPADITWAIAVKIGDTYHIQAPVWL